MKRIALFVIFALSCTILSAQSFEESMRYWTDGPLTWDDLNFKSPKDFRTSNLSFRWLTNSEKTRPSWNTVQYVSKPAVAMDKSLSWHNLERMYPCALAYDQVLFDLNELYFRKMLTELYSTDNKRSADALYAFYSDQNQSRWREIVEDTEDGTDSTMVAYHAGKIAEELAQISYPQITKSQKIFLMTFNVGYSGSLFLGQAANTFAMTHGIMLDFFCGYKQHEFGTIINGGTGPILDDYSYGDAVFRKGKEYNHNYIGFTYGYRFYDGTYFSLKPFVGLSGRMLVQTRQGKDDNNKTLGNFVVLGGAEAHFKFWRVFRNSDATEHGLGIRAYVARDLGEMNATSINIGVFYNWDTLGLK